MSPLTVRVAGWPLKIESVPAKKLPEKLGEFDSTKGSIRVSTSQKGLDRIDTTIHELFHAMLFYQGREPDDPHEERFVRALATGLTGFLHDNPEFLEWLHTSFRQLNAADPT